MSGRIAAGLIVAAVLAVLGCNDSSPTAPEVQPGPPSFVVSFEPSTVLDAHEQTIRDLISDTTARVARELPLAFVQFNVSVDANRSIPGWGLGGYAVSPRQVEIVIDPAVNDLDALLASNLPPIVAHELHHTVRLGGVGFSLTLLETLVLEGLADVFASELVGQGPFPWDQAFAESEFEEFYALAVPELDDPGFHFETWFFYGDARLPQWAGYTLGYYLVQEYLASRPGESAASLVFEPAGSFRR